MSQRLISVTPEVTNADIDVVLELISDLTEFLNTPMSQTEYLSFLSSGGAARVAPQVHYTWSTVADLLAPLISKERFRELVADRVELRY